MGRRKRDFLEGRRPLLLCNCNVPESISRRRARSIYIAYTGLHRPRHSFASLSSQKTNIEECRRGEFFFNLSNFDFLFPPFSTTLDQTTFPADIRDVQRRRFFTQSTFSNICFRVNIRLNLLFGFFKFLLFILIILIFFF